MVDILAKILMNAYTPKLPNFIFRGVFGGPSLNGIHDLCKIGCNGTQR